jgi:hypothetical protein
MVACRSSSLRRQIQRPNREFTRVDVRAVYSLGNQFFGSGFCGKSRALKHMGLIAGDPFVNKQ